MQREIRIRRSFVSLVISGRTISLTMLFLLFQIVAVLLFWNCGLSDPLFNSRLDFPVGESPRSVAVGDLDGDGAIDLAVANGSTDDVSVLLGNGDGTFQSEQRYNAAYFPRSIATGDLDGDGHLDLAVLCASRVLVLLGNGDGTFQDPVFYIYAASVHEYVALGDLNGDGDLDMAIVVHLSDGVAVALGNGDGTFQDPVRYGAGNDPQYVAIGDLDGDGDQDLAVPNWDDDTTSVLLGNGDGTFQGAVDYSVGHFPESVAMGDLDGDSTLDLAVGNVGDRSISVLLGNGDGTFQAAVDYSSGPSGPYPVAIRDINGDSALDITVANRTYDTVSVLIGNGDGTFQGARSYSVGEFPISIAIGDLDGDGTLDLAVANREDDDVSVLLQARVCVDLDGDEYGVQNTELCPQAEFDCDDANPDVNPGAPEVCDNDIDDDCDGSIDYDDPDCPCPDNDGDGYGQVTNSNCTYPELDCDDTDPDVNPGATELCDNGIDDDCDGAIDRADSDCPCLDNDGDGYGDPANINCTYPGFDCDDSNPDVNPAGSEGPVGDPTCSDTWDNDCDGLTDLNDADCVPCIDNDGDGYGDPASIGCPHSEFDCDDSNPAVNPGTLEKLRNLVDDDCSVWTPDKTSPYYTSEYMISYPIAHAYLDGDSDPDLAVPVWVVIDYPPPTPPQMFGGIEVFLNKGGASGSYGGFSGPTSALALGDLDSDGSEDMVAGAAVVMGDEDQALVFLGNGDGSFQESGYSLDLMPLSLALGDLDGDGALDLAVANADDDNVGVLLGNGDGTFQSPVTYPAGDTPASVALGDLDGDGNLDMAVADYGPSGNAVVLLGNGDGTFQAAVSYPAGEAPGLVALGDLDGDGNLDLVLMDGTLLFSHDPMSISVLLGNGDGTFQPPIAHGFGEGEGTMALGDLDGDGILDLAVSRSFTNSEGSGHVSVLFGNGDGTFRAGANYAPGMYAMGVDLMDHDGDGDLDIALADNQYDFLADPIDYYGVIFILFNNGDGTFSASNQPTWGAASTLTMKAKSASDILNCLILLLVPIGAILFWRERARNK